MAWYSRCGLVTVVLAAKALMKSRCRALLTDVLPNALDAVIALYTYSLRYVHRY